MKEYLNYNIKQKYNDFKFSTSDKSNYITI